MQPISRALPGALRQLLRAMPASRGKIEFAWSTAVGETVQRATTAVRVEGNVLLVDAVTIHWASEISRASPLILARLQSLLGEDVVRQITVRPPLHSTR